MKSTPFIVSVIIPVYNGAAFLADAVESIQQQAYGPLEIIIVDDGSTDGTAETAACFSNSINYVYQSNQGPAAARNRGLKLARANIISFLDADDLWPANKLQRQLAFLADNPSVDVVLGLTQFMQLANAVESNSEFEKISDPRIFLNLGSAIFRKSVFNQVGLFDQTLRYSEDVDWFNRARETDVSILTHQDVALLYRQHQHNMTRNKVANDLNVLKILKKSLDRRRKQNTGFATSLPKLSAIGKLEE